MKAHAVVLAALALAGSVLVGGCSYENPATGTEATYTWGTLHSQVDAPSPTVYAAALQAADDLHLTVGRAAETAFGGEIRAVDALNDVVNIRLKVLSQEQTGLTISFGVFGNRRKSVMVFDRIMANLAQVRPAMATPTIQWGEEAIEPVAR